MDLKDLMIFEAKLLSIKFKRFICRPLVADRVREAEEFFARGQV